MTKAFVSLMCLVIAVICAGMSAAFCFLSTVTMAVIFGMIACVSAIIGLVAVMLHGITAQKPAGKHTLK